jgi:hypothetical protein
MLLFPSNADKPVLLKCQDNILLLLLELYNSGQPFVNALQNLAKNFPEYLVKTKVNVLINKILYN